MTEEKRYELIEAWLAGELSGKPLQSFEAQLQTDEELALEVEIVRDLSNLNTDSPKNQLRKILSEIRKKEVREKAPVPIYWWLRNAAAALVVLVGAIFMINQFSKTDSSEIVQKPTVTMPTDEDEDGVIEFIDIVKEPEEIKNADLVQKEVEEKEVKSPIDSTPKYQFVDKEKEEIPYESKPQISEREIIVSVPEVSSYVETNVVGVEVEKEYVPEYVSNPIPKIEFFEPEHESTFEEEEAERKTAEQMERINKMAQENITTDYEVIDGDTVEVSSAVASAVLFVADVPEKRLNFLLEYEKKKLEGEQQVPIINFDSIQFNQFYDNAYKGKFLYSGKFNKIQNSKIGFYIFSQNPYDYLNNNYLFFGALDIDQSNEFSIDAEILLPSRSVHNYNLYVVFMDLEMDQPIVIERILVD